MPGFDTIHEQAYTVRTGSRQLTRDICTFVKKIQILILDGRNRFFSFFFEGNFELNMDTGYIITKATMLMRW